MFGPEQIPNGNLLKQNLPTSVINVVNCLDSSANEVCQKPELASNSENILAPDNLTKSLLRLVAYAIHGTHFCLI